VADEQNREQPDLDPPGQFISDDLRAQTANFLEELRKRLSREKSEPEPRLGPPEK
jgi:hypothetical protein